MEGVTYMNLNLNYEGFEEYLVVRRELNDGIQYIFRFPNDRGASVIKSPYSHAYEYDKWELAVVRWRDNDYELDDHSGITGNCDCIRVWLDDKEVRELLKQIQEL